MNELKKLADDIDNTVLCLADVLKRLEELNQTHVLVPREPNRDMEVAILADAHYDGQILSRIHFSDRYKAMLRAAEGGEQ